MDGVHVIALIVIIGVDLPVKVPDAEEAVGQLRAVIFGVEASRAFVLVLLVDAQHLLGQAVLQNDVLVKIVDCLQQRVDPGFELLVLFLVLVTENGTFLGLGMDLDGEKGEN